MPRQIQWGFLHRVVGQIHEGGFPTQGRGAWDPTDLEVSSWKDEGRRGWKHTATHVEARVSTTGVAWFEDQAKTDRSVREGRTGRDRGRPQSQESEHPWQIWSHRGRTNADVDLHRTCTWKAHAFERRRRSTSTSGAWNPSSDCRTPRWPSARTRAGVTAPRSMAMLPSCDQSRRKAARA